MNVYDPRFRDGYYVIEEPSLQVVQLVHSKVHTILATCYPWSDAVLIAKLLNKNEKITNENVVLSPPSGMVCPVCSGPTIYLSHEASVPGYQFTCGACNAALVSFIGSSGLEIRPRG